MSVQIVIPSRGRPHSVAVAGKLFPDALWCIGQDEARVYDVPAARQLIHPPEIIGIGRKRQWILDHVPGVVFQVDDDVTKLWCTVGLMGRPIEDPADIRQIIENAAHIAESIGAPVFGFDQAWDVRKFRPQEPLLFTGWVGTAVGFIGREIRYDQSLLSQADIDFCLRCLLEKRVIFVDHRFSFICKRFTNRGGSAGLRSAADYEAQIQKVRARWGKWVSYKKAKTTWRLGVRVSRRQPLDYGGQSVFEI